MKPLSDRHIERPDLLDDHCPEGLHVVQLGADPELPCSHVYMEAQIFSPDSKRFVFHRGSHAHGPIPGDPNHQYILCDLDNNAEMTAITDEPNTIAPSYSPDGKWIYYLIDESTPNAGSITLKRVKPDGTGRETLMVIDSPVDGSDVQPSKVYPLSTISSDGKRLATRVFLGDGIRENMPGGVIVFDLEKSTAQVIFQGSDFLNLHPQYSRSLDPERCHDILIQHNHGMLADASGTVTTLASGHGADIHVIRDDGTNFRSMPWGRDGSEFCQGHQCWRGRSDWVITSTQTYFPNHENPERMEAQLIESLPVDIDSHEGRNIANGIRNDLTRDLDSPMFHHFGTDIAGKRLISDYWIDEQQHIYVMSLNEPGKAPAEPITYLLNSGTSFQKTTQAHPFLSPDGRRGFFNSDESGVLQAYMIEGL